MKDFLTYLQEWDRDTSRLTQPSQHAPQPAKRQVQASDFREVPQQPQGRVSVEELKALMQQAKTNIDRVLDGAQKQIQRTVMKMGQMYNFKPSSWQQVSNSPTQMAMPQHNPQHVQQTSTLAGMRKEVYELADEFDRLDEQGLPEARSLSDRAYLLISLLDEADVYASYAGTGHQQMAMGGGPGGSQRQVRAYAGNLPPMNVPKVDAGGSYPQTQPQQAPQPQQTLTGLMASVKKAVVMELNRIMQELAARGILYRQRSADQQSYAA